MIYHYDATTSTPMTRLCTCAFEYKFTGKERDTESGNDYFGARYYASSMGRFMSPDWSSDPDPIPFADLTNPQSLNLYGYVQNNPLSNIDPDGHTCQTNSTDGNTYDDGDGQGCATVDQQNAARLKNGQYSATVTAPFDLLQLQQMAATKQYQRNIQSQQPAQISLQGRQFIQQVATDTAGVPTVCSVGAYAQLGNSAGAVGGSYDSNSGFKGYGTMRPMPDGPASGIAPVSISAKGDTNGHYSGGVTIRDPATRLGGGISVNDQGKPTVSASWAPGVLTVGATATLGTMGDPKCQPHP
jgi:RHS repeat-associated protein